MFFHTCYFATLGVAANEHWHVRVMKNVVAHGPEHGTRDGALTSGSGHNCIDSMFFGRFNDIFSRTSLFRVYYNLGVCLQKQKIKFKRRHK